MGRLAWQRLAPVSPPQSRAWHAMTYTACGSGWSSSVLVVPKSHLADTWEWGRHDVDPAFHASSRLRDSACRSRSIRLAAAPCCRWGQRPRRESLRRHVGVGRERPGPRHEGVQAVTRTVRHGVDPVRSRVVLFGGRAGLEPRGRPWEWDGTNWTQLAHATRPSARGGPDGVPPAARARPAIRRRDAGGATKRLWGMGWRQRTQLKLAPPRSRAGATALVTDEGTSGSPLRRVHTSPTTTSLDLWLLGTQTAATPRAIGQGCAGPAARRIWAPRAAVARRVAVRPRRDSAASGARADRFREGSTQIPIGACTSPAEQWMCCLATHPAGFGSLSRPVRTIGH